MRVFTIASLLAALLAISCQVPKPENPLEIVVFDVGDGSALLVRTPEQRTCLIDGGPTFAGANKVWPVLDSLGIREVDYCIATSYDERRIGGLDEILRRLGGEEGILFRALDRGSNTATDDFADYARVVGRRRERLRLGQEIVMGGLVIRCVAVDGRVVGSKRADVSIEADRSIALKLTYGDFDMLIPGDLCALSLPARPPLASRLSEATDEVEVLIVGEQGGANSVSYMMQELLDPVASVISVGPQQESLPDIRTMTQLTRRDRKVYLTNGSLTAVPYGRGRAVNGDVWISVLPGCFVVAGDTFRTSRQ
jgi:beta-lactamase superfamily II metal-dependent hydrolase